MSRRAWRERRRRVGALHHEDLLWSAAGASFAEAESQAAFSLANEVRLAFRRRKRKPRDFDMLRAVDIASSAMGVDPNPRVRAELGVDTVMADSIRAAAEFTTPLARFRDEHAWNDLGQPWEGRLPRLEGVMTLNPLGEALCDKLVQAEWQQSPPQMWVSSDCLRPPVEALVLAAQLLESAGGDKPSQVLGIGLGFDSGPLVLSQRLTGCTVYHAPIPFKSQGVPSSGWLGVVVNVPSAGAHAFAAGVPEWEEDHRADRVLGRARRAADQTGAKHLPQYFAALERCGATGVPLVVMADPSVHHTALRHLAKIAMPMSVDGLDTSDRGVWVGYETPPWTPSGIPAPTGRVVTLWRLS
jgi:hypothetical protein